MNVATRLTAFAAAVGLLGLGGYLVGDLTQPTGPAAAAGPAHTGTHEDGPAQARTGAPAGLASSTDGYTLVPLTTELAVGAPTELAFRVTGPDGRAVTDFAVAHDKRMHLILVRSDTTGFRHLHPVMDADGTWRADLTLPAAGSYRIFADFVPTGGAQAVLAATVAAAGEFSPVRHAPTRVATVDGYEVRLDGELTPATAAPLTLTVTKDGRPVTDLEPYLGAYGHLVALRAGDLAYLHVHPEDGPAGPQVRFRAEVPSADTYRLFLDFAHGGTVRTAELTVATSGFAAPAADHVDDGHGH